MKSIGYVVLLAGLIACGCEGMDATTAMPEPVQVMPEPVVIEEEVTFVVGDEVVVTFPDGSLAQGVIQSLDQDSTFTVLLTLSREVNGETITINVNMTGVPESALSK